MDINEYLIYAFKKLNKPQKEIIEDMNKPQSYVSAIMNGKKSVGKEIAKELSDLYGFDEGAVLSGIIPEHDKKDFKSVNKIEVDKNKILESLMEYKGFNRKAEFAKFLEIKPNVLSNWFNRNTFDENIIKNKMPEVAITYLLTGEGDFMETDQKTTNLATTKNVSKFESKEKLIDKMELFKPVPYYNINVSAGNVTFLDDGLLENQNPDDFMFVPKNIDADIAFPTFGHSMYPEISNGDRVAYKLIKDWSFFNYGMKYLIITDEQRMVKYLKKHDKEGFVLLESRNKEFEPIDMPISSIRAILQVRYIGKIEM